MKRSHFFLSLLVGIVLLASGCTTVAPPVTPTAPGTLQVNINVPPTWQPLLEDDIAAALVGHLTDVFRHDGYNGPLAEVSRGEPSPGCVLLTLNLVEWRMDHSGNINCTFSASLQNERETRQLGLFNGMALRWANPPGRFGLGDTYGAAAEDALHELYRAVEKTGLMPAPMPVGTTNTQ